MKKRKIMEIISEDDKSYEHFFYFNEEETILEYCDGKWIY
jgi:hypothetical protein